MENLINQIKKKKKMWTLPPGVYELIRDMGKKVSK